MMPSIIGMFQLHISIMSNPFSTGDAASQKAGIAAHVSANGR